MKKVFKIFLMLMLFTTVLFAFDKQADAASYTRICESAGKGSVRIGNTKYIMKYHSDTGYRVYMVKSSSKKELLRNISSGIVITDGKYIYYATTPQKNGFLRGASTMYRYTIATGKKSKLFKQNLCDGSLEFGATPCFAYKNYLYYGSQSQYGGLLWSLYVFDIKTHESKEIISGGLIDGYSVKKSGKWIKAFMVDKNDTVEAKYRFNFSGGELKKIK